MYHIGIDLGGTKIEGVVMEDRAGIIFRERIPTEQDQGYEHILAQLKRLYTTFADDISRKPHTLGIGTPGAISLKTGFLKNSNTTCLNGRLTKDELHKCFERDFAIENDANCFAMAEAKMGAGRDKDLVFGVIMGTGCGGGIIYKGKVLSGLQSIGGEWGHMSIDPKGPECYCGNRGCVETFISGGGLEQRFEIEFGMHRKVEEILERFRDKESDTVQFMSHFFVHFGRSMANLINILDPDIVVLGGGVSNVDELYTEGLKEVKRQVFSDSLETPIVKHTLGDSAGVVGAALIGI